jgi:hypothetical protein
MMRSMASVLEEEPPAASSQSARTMSDTKSGDADDKPVRRPERRKEGGAEAFDIWLQRGLHQLYDSVAKEPIPDELLSLIEQDRIDRSK